MSDLTRFGGLKLLKGEAAGMVGREAERAGVAEVAVELVFVPLGEGLQGRSGGVGAPDGFGGLDSGLRSHDAVMVRHFQRSAYSTNGSVSTDASGPASAGRSSDSRIESDILPMAYART